MYGAYYNLYNNINDLAHYDSKLLNNNICFSFPNKNPFYNINQYSKNNNVTGILTDSRNLPKKIYDKNNLIVYYNLNNSFKNHYIATQILLEFPFVLKNPLIFSAFKLYINYIKYTLQPHLFESSVANFEIDIKDYRDKIQIFIYGTDHHLNYTLNLIIDYFINRHINQNIFSTILEEFIQELKDYSFTDNIKKVSDLKKQFFEHYFYTPDELLFYINNLTFDFFTNFKNNLFINNKVVCYIEGPIKYTKVMSFGILLNKLIKISPIIYPPKNYKIIKYLNNKYIVQRNKNTEEKNSIVMYTCNIGYLEPDYSENWCILYLLLNILEMYISTEFYDNLRTKHQVGYIVNASITKIGEISLPYYQFDFVVQSDKFEINQIIDMIDSFLNNYSDNIINFSEHDFNNHKNSVLEILCKNDSSLKSSAQRNFNNILHYGIVDCNTVFKNTLFNIKLSDFINFFHDYIYNKSERKNYVFCITGDNFNKN